MKKLMAWISAVVVLAILIGAGVLSAVVGDRLFTPTPVPSSTPPLELGEPLFQVGQVLYENMTNFVEENRVIEIIKVNQGGVEFYLYVLERSPSIFYTEEQMIRKFGLPEKP